MGPGGYPGGFSHTLTWVIGRGYARLHAAHASVELKVAERSAELHSTIQQLGAAEAQAAGLTP